MARSKIAPDRYVIEIDGESINVGSPKIQQATLDQITAIRRDGDRVPTRLEKLERAIVRWRALNTPKPADAIVRTGLHDAWVSYSDTDQIPEDRSERDAAIANALHQLQNAIEYIGMAYPNYDGGRLTLAFETIRHPNGMLAMTNVLKELRRHVDDVDAEG
jgi:hypothetical protein